MQTLKPVLRHERKNSYYGMSPEISFRYENTSINFSLAQYNKNLFWVRVNIEISWD